MKFSTDYGRMALDEWENKTEGKVGGRKAIMILLLPKGKENFTFFVAQSINAPLHFQRPQFSPG